MESLLKSLAAQLRCPKGEAGIQLGRNMNLNNLTVILNAFANLELQEEDRILELGYGNGGLLGHLLSLAENMHYTGLELSPILHQEALRINKPYIQANLAEYYLFDGINLPFTQVTFDKIISVNTIYFWQQPTILLNNICQALKPNGLLCLAFCDSQFMQTLPFVQYGFQLYDSHSVKQLTQELPLVLMHQDQGKDKCISKSGELVERKFISMVFKKVV